MQTPRGTPHEQVEPRNLQAYLNHHSVPGTHSRSRSVSINHVCVDCKRISTRQTRCEQCERLRNQHRNASRTHLQGSYKREAKLVRESATHCWLCGEGHRADDPFTADHVVPSDPRSALLPAHRSCNSRRGRREAVPVRVSVERVARAPRVISEGWVEDE
jgi:hypothetical protein